MSETLAAAIAWQLIERQFVGSVWGFGRILERRRGRSEAVSLKGFGQSLSHGRGHRRAAQVGKLTSELPDTGSFLRKLGVE